MSRVAGSAAAVVVLVVAVAGCERRDTDDVPAVQETQNATLSEWSVGLERSTVQAGEHTFVITNTGSYPHAFEIEGEGEEWETDAIPSGGTTNLTVRLQPGTYEVYCPIDDGHGDHRDLGMTTTLTVQ